MILKLGGGPRKNPRFLSSPGAWKLEFQKKCWPNDKRKFGPTDGLYYPLVADKKCCHYSRASTKCLAVARVWYGLMWLSVELSTASLYCFLFVFKKEQISVDYVEMSKGVISSALSSGSRSQWVALAPAQHGHLAPHNHCESTSQ